ncbi:uncharacterized protein PAC_13603 [Phialocephala subalpina]|uniref:C2H2-type domain-containing protein n=1 Tax=Phialocephala subalpina TaxID=576137 RepID=A0A1L7XFG0_9HELO|nr:uncharacterized protein PAC_13603 [Phialocephala subalpina]
MEEIISGMLVSTPHERTQLETLLERITPYEILDDRPISLFQGSTQETTSFEPQNAAGSGNFGTLQDQNAFGATFPKPTSRRPKANNRVPLASGSLTPRSPTFACHFFKKDPKKYNGYVSRKYMNCIHPHILESDLHRLKDHFRNHRVPQCSRCYYCFGNSEALMEHRRSPAPCISASSAIKEGIDDSEWERISQVEKKRKRGRLLFQKCTSDALNFSNERTWESSGGKGSEKVPEEEFRAACKWLGQQAEVLVAE